MTAGRRQGYVSGCQAGLGRGNATRRISAYALLVAIPTIIFSLYGTTFDHVPLLGEPSGYGVMLVVTVVVSLFAWWRLRRARWI